MAASPIVDLPAPDSPIRPRTSPRRSVRSTPLTISVHLSSLWPSMRRPRISSRTSPLPRGFGAGPADLTVSTTVIRCLLLEPARLVQEPVDDEVDGDRQQRNGARRQQRRRVTET